MSEQQEPKAKRSWRWVWFVLGFVLIVVAGVLYIWFLLQPPPGWEIWPMLGFLTFMPLGVFLLGKGSHERPKVRKSTLVRMTEGGKEGTPEREEWVEAQTQRSYHITKVAITIMVLAAALYVRNHVTGKLYPCTQKQEEKIHWQTHEERLEAGSVYETQEGDMLASVAVSKGISLAELAETNPAAKLKVTEVMTSTLDSTKTLDTADDGKTLQEYAQDLGISTSEVALGFSAATLEAGQKLRIPKQPVVDYRQWFDWWCWALIGVAAYLLKEDARYFREIPQGKGDFLGETLWYWAQFITGPLVAMVVLLVLTQIDLKLLGDENGAAIAVDMSQFVPDLLFIPAFLLGFYSRVARHVLDGIMKALFGSAWLAAHGEFKIVSDDLPPEDNVVGSKKAVIFKTRPATEVTWLTSLGNIEATGAYTAPEVTDAPKDVIITAVAGRGVAMASKVITVVPHKFKVITVAGVEPEVTPGGKLKLTIDPLPTEEAEQKEIAWKITTKIKPGTEIKPEKGKETTLTASDKEKPDTEITITATYKGHSEPITLKVVEGAALPPKLEKIEARIDDTPVGEKGTVEPGKQIAFTVKHTLGEDKVQEIKWSTTVEATQFRLLADKGESVDGKVQDGATAGTSVAVTAEYEDLKVPFTFKVGALPPPALPTKLEKIEAASDNNPVDMGGMVDPGNQATFKVIPDLEEEEAGKIQWSKTPEGDAHFKWIGEPKGGSVVGEVPSGATADTEITVTAKHSTLGEVTFKFKVGTPPSG